MTLQLSHAQAQASLAVNGSEHEAARSKSATEKAHESREDILSAAIENEKLLLQQIEALRATQSELEEKEKSR